MSFSNDIDYLNYIDVLTNKSYYEKNIEFDPTKDMLTLVTCSYEYDGARTVVHAINK